MHLTINGISKYFGIVLTTLALGGCGGASSSGSSDGKAGSMSRFSLTGDFLYAISGPKLRVFNLANDPAQPTVYANLTIGWNIETLYSAKGHLFVGAQNGVYIFDNTTPGNPQQVAKFLHVMACDPVVVSGDYAYVTLRSGGARCWGGTLNQLDVIDLKDMSNPTLVKSYAMENPKGLGVDDGSLYVCDGRAGMKTYDLSDPASPAYSHTDTALDCYDLIPDSSFLVVSDANGIYQVDTKVVDLTSNKVSHIQLETP